MIRDQIIDYVELDHDPDFRWRGRAVTRIENLSDIAFAIALGMLITGVDAPRNVAGLREFLLYAFPTAAGFAVLFGLWHGHYTFFRRYGVADKTIVTLNALLIFVTLFMAYPLRFAFDSLFSWIITLFSGDYSRSLALGVDSYATAGELVGWFSLFYAVAFALFALMQGHVARKADVLKLSAYELAVTKAMHVTRWGQFLIALVTSAVCAFTIIGPAGGMLHSLFGLAYWVGVKRHPSAHLKLSDMPKT